MVSVFHGLRVIAQEGGILLASGIPMYSTRDRSISRTDIGDMVVALRSSKSTYTKPCS